jgi:hypothetical protein
MKIHHFTVRVGWPDLSTVLQEIASTLISDDWSRTSTGDNQTFYYILGTKAWEADQKDAQEFELLSVPTPQAISPLRESEVHAKVAAAPKSYVDQSRARLERTGADPEAIRIFIEGMRGGDVNWASLAGKFGPPGTERFAAFADLVQALVMENGIDPEDTISEAHKRRERDIATQKIYLREVSQLYRSVVRRAASLESWTFSDAHLNEASRCYVYGFFRATVILGATAVEKCLRDAIGPDAVSRIEKGLRDAIRPDAKSKTDAKKKKSFYRSLVDEALKLGFLGRRVRLGEEPEYAVYSREIFTLRNGVAHKGYEPAAKAAAELLTKAREVVEYIRGRRSGPLD